MFNKLLKEKAHGIGKVTYPLRQIGFTYAAVVIFLYYTKLPEYSSLGLYSGIAFLMVFPTLLFFTYKLTDCNKRFGEFGLNIDAFWGGVAFSTIHFSIVPVFTLFTLISANMISVRGIKYFRNIPLYMGSGAFLGSVFFGFTVEVSELLLTNVISYSMIFLYFAFYANTVHVFIDKRKAKAKQVISDQEEEIKAQNEDLIKKTNQLEDAMLKLNESMSYARNIQRAMLPSYENFKCIFEDGFIYFRPREELSGDFYWFEEVNGKKIIAAVDCTGHGVPGALMSMIGNDLLSDIVVRKGITSPEAILEEMDKGVRKVLRQDTTKNSDGMDAAICVIDSEQKTIQFSGANNPLVWVSGDKMTCIRGSRKTVGGVQESVSEFFDLHELDANEPGFLYIFSDGFQDQFGGEEGKKYMSKNFRQLLFANSNLEMKKQEIQLEDTIIDWMGDQDQVDDILVIGLAVM